MRLVNSCGAGTALAMLLTAEPIDAETALRTNLVWKVVPHERLMEEAELTARQILRNSQVAVRSAKETILDVIGRPLDEQLRLEALNAYSCADPEETMGLLRRFYDKSDAGRAGSHETSDRRLRARGGVGAAQQPGDQSGQRAAARDRRDDQPGPRHRPALLRGQVGFEQHVAGDLGSGLRHEHVARAGRQEVRHVEARRRGAGCWARPPPAAGSGSARPRPGCGRRPRARAGPRCTRG